MQTRCLSYFTLAICLSGCGRSLPPRGQAPALDQQASAKELQAVGKFSAGPATIEPAEPAPLTTKLAAEEDTFERELTTTATNRAAHGQQPQRVALANAIATLSWDSASESQPTATATATSSESELRRLLAADQMTQQDLEEVRRQADVHTRAGVDLASRGGVFAARAEFFAALQKIADAFDHIYRCEKHSRALQAAQTALQEAEAFVQPAEGGRQSAAALAAGHVTPLLRDAPSVEVSCLQASRVYHRYALQQFAAAVGNEPAASLALHGLGKLQPMLKQPHQRGPAEFHLTACTYFQAALLVDDQNFLAANELAVQLACLGKLPDAYQLLVAYAPLADQPAVWNNLAGVCDRLQLQPTAGQARQAAVASAGRKQMREQAKGWIASSQGVVWVAPEQFVQQGTAWAAPPAPVAENPATTPAGPNNLAMPAPFHPGQTPEAPPQRRISRAWPGNWGSWK